MTLTPKSTALVFASALAVSGCSEDGADAAFASGAGTADGSATAATASGDAGDDAGTDGQDGGGGGTGSASDSASSSDSMSGGATGATGGDDSAGSTGTTGGGGETGDGTGGPIDPIPPEIPPEFPGVETGLCDSPGEFRYCYSGAPPTYLVGACAPGLQQCVAEDLDFGNWGPCEGETPPAQEVCDGLDNDCDGLDDEDQGANNCGLGECNHDEPACVAGAPNACDPFDGAVPEICDNLDNDCDGDIDEGLGGQTLSCGVGQCQHDVSACVNGQMPVCDPFAGATSETCDDIDNDCDGQTDEGLPDITCGLGVCLHTVASCVNGFPQMCDPLDGASTEICDGLDNDCDGLVDEDQGVWTCGENQCQVTVPRCIGGVPQPESTCVPIPGGTEICGDGIDNNCDGVAPPCAETFLVGTDTVARPIDVIWAVDSSGSMSQEMSVVETEINDFALFLANSGSSTQLHLLADRGDESFEICVAPPLGGANCADNPTAGFWQYDTNGPTNRAEFIHSSNALGRIMQQASVWTPRLQPNSHVAFIVTTDDDGDDPTWVSPEDNDSTDDCSSTALITNATTGNVCRWASGGTTYTSLAYDHGTVSGFTTFMVDFFPGLAIADDWSFYSIIGNTGTDVLSGADDQYEFNNCSTSREDGDEYVKLSLLTGRQDAMISICAPDWDLTGLAQEIVDGIPNDTYVLEGVPVGNCLNINPATITATVNGIPAPIADWTYDAPSCTLTFVQNIPVVGDNVVIVYDNF